MSDFDKEAERERLREKYEQDQQKREASERMSDLLLKGATMTNAHCNNCGDPIFRYDGDEFCPTCQQVVTNEDAMEAEAGEGADEEAARTGGDADGQAANAANGDENADAASPDHIEIKQPDGPAVQTGSDTAGNANANADRQTADDSPAGADESAETAGTGSQRDQPQSQPAPAPSTGRDGQPTAPSTQGSTDEEFGAARASLVRTLRTHAERAENCDDPRRARDHLAAAREAAETLSALSGSY
ncbi:Sjogren's syndrome/scleroderma autoantigen 1 family protein [Halosimplex salinum]|uniref:Sjogren's syndrome/scleroderma autoantigen 1 family protein n=1 Tax=Halosimplex salinum TaxID=1710538 RepID=UPI000F485AB2|nr:Sjogren's syndrome/scleroderma autoantigen 1 family protein [Halosimplex salinum]